MELAMPTLFLKRSGKPSFSHFLTICAITSLGLVACGKKEEATPQGAGMVMPVSVISVKSTSVPITAEAVALAWITANPDKADAHRAALEKRWTAGNSAMRFFKTTNIWLPTIEAGAKVYALEQIAGQSLAQFKQGYPEFANYTEEQKAIWISRARDEIFGIWVTQYAAQAIVRFAFGSASLLGTFLRTFGGVAGTVITKKPGFGAQLAQEALILFITYWLQSEAGTSLIKKHIGPAFFNVTGAIVTGSWDWLVTKIAEWTGFDINQTLTPNTTNAVNVASAASTNSIKWSDPKQDAKDYADFEKSTRSRANTGKMPGEL
jgi:hypothetical protein